MGKVFNALKRVDDAMVTETATIPNEPASAIREPAPAVSPQPTASVGVADISHSGQWDDRLILAMSTTGPVAESIRALRTRILFPASGEIPRTILVTSASPGEGKSLVCASLAISLAQGVDNHCLLVDCDLRKPMQQVLFGENNMRGLSDYLCRRKALPDLLLPSGIEKLSLLLSGSRSVNPAELLGSAAMMELVSELAHRYSDRVVLLDSPPLHAATETAVLAQHVDAVVLVVRAGVARREYVRVMADAIGHDKILGVVFNGYRATPFDARVFGYYEYQNDYYYGDR